MQPPRPEPPRLGTERETLEGFLDFLRATLEWKASGLTDAQLDQRLAPSTMTLGGLLKHLAYVEDWWFTAVLAGQPDPEPWASAPWAEDPDWEWRSAATDTGDTSAGCGRRASPARDRPRPEWPWTPRPCGRTVTDGAGRIAGSSPT